MRSARLAALVFFSAACAACLPLQVLTPEESSSVPTSTAGAAVEPFLQFGQESYGVSVNNNAMKFAGSDTISWPWAISCGSTYCYAADTYNSRVLVFNGTPGASNPPIAALGQPSLTTVSSNAGAVSASSLQLPSGVLVSGTRLFVADTYAHRVLIWNTLPTASGTPADVVVGQADFSSQLPNRGAASPTAKTLFWPYGMVVSGTKLLIADSYNNRILIYNSIPTANDAAADLVIGQSDFISTNTATSATAMSSPGKLLMVGSKLVVADIGNSRALVYNTVPTSNGAAADVVIGAPDKNTAGSGSTAASTYYPYGLATQAGKLYVADTYNYRILVFNTVPTADGTAANAVIGQSSLTANTACSPVTANCLALPADLDFGPDGKLVVVETTASRLTVFNTVPSGVAAHDDRFGQTSASGAYGNRAGTNAYGLDAATYSQPVGDYLAISDQNNNRVAFWKKKDPSVGAQFVLGQADVNSGAANRGGAVSASGFSSPNALAVSDTQFFVSDWGNHRILVFNRATLAMGVAADYVIGQPNMTSNLSNVGGTLTRKSISNPEGMMVYGTRLYVSDTQNHRVLSYDLPITGSYPDAAAVFMQPNFTTATGTCGTVVTPYPESVWTDGTRMAIISRGVHGAFYDFVLGGGTNAATGFFGISDAACTQVTPKGLNTLSTYANPGVFHYAHGYYFLADKNEGRVLVFKNMPGTGFSLSADKQIGQLTATGIWDYSPSDPNRGGPLILDAPTDISSDEDAIYIADRWGYAVHRIPKGRISELLRD